MKALLRATGELTMAHAGDIIENPISGAQLKFLKTSRDTNGELVQVDFWMKPFGRGTGGGDHIHPQQEERATILEGRLSYHRSGEKREAASGEIVSLPPGVSHYLYNNHPEPLHMIVEFRPALNTEHFWEKIFELGRQGKLRPNGNPNLLQLAVLMNAFPDETYSAGIPVWLQKLVFNLLAPIGRAFGRTVYVEE